MFTLFTFAQAGWYVYIVYYIRRSFRDDQRWGLTSITNARAPFSCCPQQYLAPGPLVGTVQAHKATTGASHMRTPRLASHTRAGAPRR